MFRSGHVYMFSDLQWGSVELSAPKPHHNTPGVQKWRDDVVTQVLVFVCKHNSVENFDFENPDHFPSNSSPWQAYSEPLKATGLVWERDWEPVVRNTLPRQSCKIHLDLPLHCVPLCLSLSQTEALEQLSTLEMIPKHCHCEDNH